MQKLHNLASLCGPSLYPDEQSKEEAHYMFQDLVLKGCRTVKVTEAAIPDSKYFVVTFKIKQKLS